MSNGAQPALRGHQACWGPGKSTAENGGAREGTPFLVATYESHAQAALPGDTWVLLSPYGRCQRPSGTAASLGDSGTPRGHRASLESLSVCSGKREADTRMHTALWGALSLGVSKFWRDPGGPQRGGTGPRVPRHAGEDGGGCRRRMLLTQDLPKWFLFLLRGWEYLARGSKQMEGAG